jgi:uncharacterized protein (TIGR02246 family)
MQAGDSTDQSGRLTERIGRLEDERAIRDLIRELVRCSDERRLDAYLACFAADATFEIVGQGVERGIGEIRAATEGRWGSTPGGIGRHLVTTSMVRVEGETAVATSYVTILEGGIGGPGLGNTAVYEDGLVRESGAWRLKAHVIRVV